MKEYSKINLYKYFISQGISLLGSSVVSLAIIWYVTLLTDSGIAVAGVTITTYLPQLLTLLIGGKLADRYPSKRIVIISDSSIALSTLVLAGLFTFGYDNLWWIFFFNTLRALGTGIQLPADRSMLPKLVSGDKLMQANSLSTGMWSIVQLVSPALGGVLMKNCAMQYVLMVDVVTAIIGVVILGTVKVREIHDKNTDMVSDNSLQEGMGYLWSNRVLKKCILFYFLFQFLVMPASQLVPMLVTRRVGENILLLSLTETAFSVGALLVSIIMSAREIKVAHYKMMSIAAIVFGITMIMLLGANMAWWFVMCLFVMGFGSPIYFTPLMTHIQENTDEIHMGRVFAMVDIVSTIAIPCGMAIFGPLGNVNIEMSFAIPGVLLIILGLCSR